jgi:hypothetical protein
VAVAKSEAKIAVFMVECFCSRMMKKEIMNRAFNIQVWCIIQY